MSLHLDVAMAMALAKAKGKAIAGAVGKKEAQIADAVWALLILSPWSVFTWMRCCERTFYKSSTKAVDLA